MDLYAVYLGGHMSEGRLGEDHEVVFVVAEDAHDARSRAKAKWTGAGGVHVDALVRLDQIDGHVIRLEPAADHGDLVELDTTPPSKQAPRS